MGVGDAQFSTTGRLGYLDSGTSYIFGQPTDVIAFHSLVPNAVTTDNNTWTVPCSTTTSISFTFSGVTYNVSSVDWVGPSVDGVCTSNVYAVAVVDTNSWLIGDTFFKNVYALFDVDQDRVGKFILCLNFCSYTNSYRFGAEESCYILGNINVFFWWAYLYSYPYPYCTNPRI